MGGISSAFAMECKGPVDTADEEVASGENGNGRDRSIDAGVGSLSPRGGEACREDDKDKSVASGVVSGRWCA